MSRVDFRGRCQCCGKYVTLSLVSTWSENGGFYLNGTGGGYGCEYRLLIEQDVETGRYNTADRSDSEDSNHERSE